MAYTCEPSKRLTNWASQFIMVFCNLGGFIILSIHVLVIFYCSATNMDGLGYFRNTFVNCNECVFLLSVIDVSGEFGVK